MMILGMFAKKNRPQYLNKPSFCSGSCDEIHANKIAKQNFIERFLKHL